MLYFGFVQFFDFLPTGNGARASKPESLLIGATPVPTEFVRNVRARRYVLRLRRDGTLRVTIPRGGSVAFASEFAEKNRRWIERQLDLRKTEAQRPREWVHGTEILFRGDQVRLDVRVEGELKVIQFGDQIVAVPGSTADLRGVLERYLRSMAEKELPSRTLELATLHQTTVRRISVRNQRSRWGSCSARGTISLNWRLIQAPDSVRDYLIVHELMHRREMNHSARFWGLVRAACPDFAQAEKWLNTHSYLLR